jgi:mannosyltransferase
MNLRAEPVWHKAWLMFLALTLLALVIRLAWLGRKSLWLDEVYSLNRASLNVTQIVETKGDPHPPLFYVGLHYWLALGRSEFTLRLPSVLWGVVSVGLLYLLGRRWADEWTGSVAALLLALAPMHVWFSQEARMYAASCAFGLLALWTLSEAVATGRRRAWLGWVLATVLGLYTHYATVALLAVEVVLLWPVCYWAGVLRRRVLPAALALIGILVLFGPWLKRLVGGELDPFLSGSVWYFGSISSLLATLGIPIGNRQLFIMLAVMCLAGVALLNLLGWRLAGRLRQRAFSVGAGVVSVTVLFYAAALVASVWPRGYGIRRQMLIFFPYFLLAGAWSLMDLRHRNWWAGGLVAITLPFLVANLAVTEQQDWRSVAAFMAEQAQSQDVILSSASYTVECLDYYYHGAVERAGVVASNVPGWLSKLTKGRARVWLVLCDDMDTDPGGTIPDWLGIRRSMIGQYSFPGIRVRLYGASAE